MRGTLIPRSYSVRFSYLTGSFYRATLYLLVAAIVSGAVVGYLWAQLSTKQSVLEKNEALLSETRAQVTNKQTTLGDTVLAYNRLVQLFQYRRIPYAPVAGAIANTISPECSLLAAIWSVDNDAKKKGQRVATLSMSVFVADIGGTLDTALAWIENLRREVSRDRLVASQPQISQPEVTAGGQIVDVTLFITLDSSTQLAPPESQ